MTRNSIALLLSVGFIGAAFAAARDAKPEKQAPGLADLSFFAGHWSRTEGGSTVEEVWLPPRGGFLIGMNRTTSKNGSEFEFLRIAEKDGRIAYLASPGGAPPTVFRLKSLEGTTVVFENPEHDYPTTIRYERDGDALTATIAGKDGANPMSWNWKLAAKLD